MAAPIAGMAQDAKQAGTAMPKADPQYVGFGWRADIGPADVQSLTPGRPKPSHHFVPAQRRRIFPDRGE
jgi:hypothetical protein